MVYAQWKANAYNPALIVNALCVTQNSETHACCKPALIVQVLWEVQAYTSVVIVHVLCCDNGSKPSLIVHYGKMTNVLLSLMVNLL